MLRVITLNLNGIRSAVRKGLLPWLARRGAGVVCLQELKAQAAAIHQELRFSDPAPLTIDYRWDGS